MPINLEEIRKKLEREVIRCAYCGFCEYVCPTLNFVDPRRQFGPRGRVNLISFALYEGLVTKATIEGVYSCLECGACTLECIEDLDIVEIVRSFRVLVSHGVIKVKGEASKVAPVSVVR